MLGGYFLCRAYEVSIAYHASIWPVRMMQIDGSKEGSDADGCPLPCHRLTHTAAVTLLGIVLAVIPVGL
jgi:hypothetical protein